jgi:hypothetical protein
MNLIAYLTEAILLEDKFQALTNPKNPAFEFSTGRRDAFNELKEWLQSMENTQPETDRWSSGACCEAEPVPPTLRSAGVQEVINNIPTERP